MQSAAWVAPDGNFYRVLEAKHSETSLGLVYHIYGEQVSDMYDSHRVLERKGWIHLCSSGWFDYYTNVTQAQLDVLGDLSLLDGHFSEEVRYRLSDVVKLHS